MVVDSFRKVAFVRMMNTWTLWANSARDSSQALNTTTTTTTTTTDSNNDINDMIIMSCN